MSSLEATPSKVLTIAFFVVVAFLLAKFGAPPVKPLMPSGELPSALHLPIVEKSLPSAPIPETQEKQDMATPQAPEQPEETWNRAKKLKFSSQMMMVFVAKAFRP